MKQLCQGCAMMKGTTCDGGDDVVPWWGNVTNVVWQIVHLECTLCFFGGFFVIFCVALLHQPHSKSNNSRNSYPMFFLMCTQQMRSKTLYCYSFAWLYTMTLFRDPIP